MDKYDPDDPVAVYIREVSKIEPLARNEETQLFKELGDEGNWDKAKESVARILIESKLALVVSVAQRHSASGIPLLELIQEGNIGLENAVRSFALQRQLGNWIH